MLSGRQFEPSGLLPLKSFRLRTHRIRTNAKKSEDGFTLAISDFFVGRSGPVMNDSDLCTGDDRAGRVSDGRIKSRRRYLGA